MEMLREERCRSQKTKRNCRKYKNEKANEWKKAALKIQSKIKSDKKRKKRKKQKKIQRVYLKNDEQIILLCLQNLISLKIEWETMQQFQSKKEQLGEEKMEQRKQND